METLRVTSRSRANPASGALTSVIWMRAFPHRRRTVRGCAGHASTQVCLAPGETRGPGADPGTQVKVKVKVLMFSGFHKKKKILWKFEQYGLDVQKLSSNNLI